MQKALRPLWFLLAVIFLFEAWVWHRVVAFGHWLVQLLPFRAFKRGVARLIALLPPWAALIVFGAPVLVVEPLKFVALYFIAHGYLFLGILGFIALKFIAFAIIAFMFELCRDKLLQMPWFVKVYQWVLWAEHWAHALLDPYKARVKQALADARALLAPVFARARALLGNGRGPVSRYARALRMKWRRET